MVTYESWYWKSLDEQVGETRLSALDLSWLSHSRYLFLAWGLRITWRKQLLGQVTAMQQRSCYHSYLFPSNFTSLTPFFLPGSQRTAEHVFHISTASSGKRIHSPSKFTCHLETYSGQCSNSGFVNHCPTLKKARTSVPCANNTVLPKQETAVLWMLHISPLL